MKEQQHAFTELRTYLRTTPLSAVRLHILGAAAQPLPRRSRWMLRQRQLQWAFGTGLPLSMVREQARRACLGRPELW